MAKVTMADIARETSLSRGTVSRALNDRPEISEETKARVRDACLKLNYARSHAARSLATGRSLAIAAVVADLRDPFIGGIIRGLGRGSRSHRYCVHVEQVGLGESPVEHLRNLGMDRFDGLFVAAALSADALRALSECLIHGQCVVVCGAPGALPCDVLWPDQREAGRLAARRLLRDTPHEARYLHMPVDEDAELRRLGFEEVCQEYGRDPDRVVLVVGPHVDLDEIEHTADWGTLQGLATSDDALAISAMLALARRRRLPGRDVAVIGYGNEPIGARLKPSLSTVDFAPEEIGLRAMDILIQRLSGARHDRPQTEVVSPRLVARETTLCLPSVV
jgi:LacI family transcriptional regulator